MWMRSAKVSKHQTDIVIVLAHIDAAYLQLQASLTTLAHNTSSKEHRANIGAAQQDLDRWCVLHWSNISEPLSENRKM
jgi:hypothetical protein